MGPSSMVNEPVAASGAETAAQAEVVEVTVVTGAASGIGAAFARRLAAQGHKLVLLDRDPDGLARIAADTQGEPLLCDLADPGAAERVAAFLHDRGATVGWLINNAGIARRGAVGDVPVESFLETVAVNAVAPVALIAQFLPGMLRRGRGVIVNVASSAALLPVPYLSVYGASKAFLLSFTEALWVECLGRGVRVLCLCPSGTDTAFQERSGIRRFNEGRDLLAPDEVVEAALRVLRGSRCTAVVGGVTKVLFFAKQFLSRSLQARLAGWMMRKYR